MRFPRAQRVPTTRPRGRAAALFAGLALSLALLTGCDSEGAQTDCSLDACTVTFDRGVEASANILGVEAKLISAQDDRVTLEVAGEQISLTVGQAGTEVAGLLVSLKNVTGEQVVVEVARNPGG